MTLIIRIEIPAWLERIGVPFVLLIRRLRYGYAFRKIPLTQGKFAIVDPEDYPRLIIYKWHANRSRFTYYAQRKVWDAENKKERTIKMHRQILKVPDPLVVDHINHKGFDNRKANLRPATHSQNVCNRTKSPRVKSRSRYKGLTWHKRKGKWHARIRIRGQTKSLGYFDNETDAAKAYDMAACKFHGEFASVNFPPQR